MDFFDEMEEEAAALSQLMQVPAVTLRNTKGCTDDSLMTFGKYKGAPVRDVPAQYLLWWFNQQPTHFPELYVYIAKNKKQLEDEAEAFEDQPDCLGYEYEDTY